MLAAKLQSPGDWPVLIEPRVADNLAEATRIIEQAPAIVPALGTAGAKWLEQKVRGGFDAWDGPVLSFASITPGSIELYHSGFIAGLCCAEPLRAEWQAGGATPLRDAVEKACGGDPLHNGAGRRSIAAAAGLLVFDGPDGPEFALGRRRMGMAQYSGFWHVAPAGGVDPTDQNPFGATLANEIHEELIMDEGEGLRMADTASLLGLSFDLLCLRMEACFLLRCSGERPQLHESEHVETMWRPFTVESIRATLDDLGPGKLVPTGAGTLELACVRLQRQA